MHDQGNVSTEFLEDISNCFLDFGCLLDNAESFLDSPEDGEYSTPWNIFLHKVSTHIVVDAHHLHTLLVKKLDGFASNQA